MNLRSWSGFEKFFDIGRRPCLAAVPGVISPYGRGSGCGFQSTQQSGAVHASKAGARIPSMTGRVLAKICLDIVIPLHNVAEHAIHTGIKQRVQIPSRISAFASHMLVY
jgi:hypothetical protein